MPLSGVVGRADVMDAAAPGGLGGTYAGNPLAVASAHAVLEIIDEEKLCERATQLGDVLKAKLNSLQADVPQIADVRGPGAMIAVEFLKPGSGEPDADFTKRVQARALERGLLLLVCGVYSNVVRFLFPLTIPQAVFDEAKAIQTSGIGDEYIAKVKEQRRRSHEVELKDNNFWMHELVRAYDHGDDPRIIPEITSILDKIDSNHVRAAARRYITPKQYVVGVLKPEGATVPAVGSPKN